MLEDDLKILFRKLSKGTLTEEEHKILSDWMAANKAEGLSDQLDKDWLKFEESEVLQQGPRWLKDRRSNTRTYKIKVYRRRMVVAASILLLCTVGVYYWSLKYQQPRLVQVENLDQRKKMIQLPDGSKVWLKRNSKLTYWKPFQNQERKFTLQGEAFFEVETDSIRPFIVQSEIFNTTVLGTSFNMITEQASTNPEVALVEGKVKVAYQKSREGLQPVILNPGEKVRINPDLSKMVMGSYIEDAPYAWTNDILYFEKANAYEVAKILESWYNIKFTIVDDYPVSGILVHRYDTRKYKLEEVLRDISNVMPYTFFQLQNGSFEIRPKRIEK